MLIRVQQIGWGLHLSGGVSDTAVFCITFSESMLPLFQLKTDEKAVSIIPLASLISFGTEEIALRVGQTLGGTYLPLHTSGLELMRLAGLLNASLGNAVEVILAIVAL